MAQFPEREWKKLRKIRDRALSRFCARSLAKIRAKVEGDDAGNEHEAFLGICRLVRKQNRELADLFDDWRRSTALVTLMGWAKAGVITEEEFQSFAEETKESVRAFVKPKFHK
jgi:hypothetical protein